jgi:hypothetical protein
MEADGINTAEERVATSDTNVVRLPQEGEDVTGHGESGSWGSASEQRECVTGEGEKITSDYYLSSFLCRESDISSNSTSCGTPQRGRHSSNLGSTTDIQG